MKKTRVVGVEVNGGEGNEFSNGKIKIHGSKGDDLRGIVLNGTFLNKFDGYNIEVVADGSKLQDALEDLQRINDETINHMSGSSYKEDCINTVNSLVDGSELESKLKNLSLMLTVWSQIKQELKPALDMVWEHVMSGFEHFQ
ncbi:hypothetical protein [Klebsiella quasipneumoniae]|uniref:hypothetical protein n=1 Tax=Klebsiella quasipneumoniae TaxID=1463165 RepID=UPI0024B06073|nr:hypothetical protein [Klebsiella quasipneumoniae]MDI9087978.1 hypothetical protein [Klebsiella quasipneumoniae subsp. similipneumoniae]HEN5006089.1 hypothetical protein [Klebsiella quasipneumoniae subsp. similipneumoniae]HEN5287808.1 hypothetical protein [Klebsiella quasipneumoniae subsp. similipneumoniae]HEO0722546.1 hypothetical protein [Klebsiella quasipneumoniae subsp. similipneumoniae]